jgi:hypothetical protein
VLSSIFDEKVLNENQIEISETNREVSNLLKEGA